MATSKKVTVKKSDKALIPEMITSSGILVNQRAINATAACTQGFRNRVFTILSSSLPYSVKSSQFDEALKDFGTSITLAFNNSYLNSATNDK